MARRYAGTLGSLAMAVTLLRGALNGAAIEPTMAGAAGALVALAAVGAMVGYLAEQAVETGVRQRMEKELNQLQATGA